MDVVLLDERPRAGGQFHKQPALRDDLPASLAADRQMSQGKALIDRVRQSGADVRLNAEIWAAFPPNEFAVFDGQQSLTYQAQRVIVATGAYERGLPLPGWTLPGVMTTGAAQTMLRSYGILPGKRILVAGNGPFNQQVSLELKRAGANVLAVAELAAKPGLWALPISARMLVSAPRLTFDGLRYVASLSTHGIPVLYQSCLLSVERAAGGLRATIGKVGDAAGAATQSFDADVVCMGYGFQPNNEILRLLGCRHSYDPRFGHLRTDRTSSMETSVAGVFATGDCCGLGGAPAARAEGVIAAVAVLESLERPVADDVARLCARKRKELQRHRNFQAALWDLYAARRYHSELATPDTLVCRCENVSLRDIEAALDVEADIGSIKRRTRLGMGPCQGRYCAPIAAELIAARTDTPVQEFSFFAPRSPIKPIRITDIVNAQQFVPDAAPPEEPD